ncbi:hypothetical protein ESCO_006158 [Escovopsis weberi]|uniref:Sulfatase N-terminal domain-containing protein n=1 Tax=Escovopsis weberi TaxID=150374 RepID=A0A0M8MWK9_ESCWE|nr:hypothetical protein ESCO_006158 [Escovopsis weberi]
MFPSLAPFAFAVFFISVISTKLLHLTLSAYDIPASVFIFCLPAIFFIDAVLICSVWFLLRRKSATWLSFFGAVLGLTICLITLTAAASQWGFFYQTGGQVRWADAKAYANKDTVKVLLSESNSALAFGSGIVSVAWITRTVLFRFVGAFVTTAEIQIIKTAQFLLARFGRRRKASDDSAHIKESSADALLAAEEGASNHDDDSDDNGSDSDLSFSSKIDQAHRMGPFVWWLLISAVTLTVFYIIVSVDPDWPYAEVMTTLPLPLMAIFAPKSHECIWGQDVWPLPDLISRSRWENAHGNFKGWAPGSENDLVRKYRERVPSWLPTPVPPGFERWNEIERLIVFGNRNGTAPTAETEDSSETAAADDQLCPTVEQDPFYNPVNDPLRITNLDVDILKPVRDALKDGSVKIRHIALIKLESTREELFPLQKGSDIYKFIVESHPEADRPSIDKLLSSLTPNAEKITGKTGYFQRPSDAGNETSEDTWQDPTREGFGGINVVGALTPSSVSTKSLAASHCGVWPLPVDAFEEADSQSYQPCLPQVLNLFNRRKTSENLTDDFRAYQWKSAFFASVVDDYDRQHKFEKTIGFQDFVNKQSIADEEERQSTGAEEINYFGYPETILSRFVKNHIGNITEKKERMFFSHFTSTTHHPWALPKWFKSVDYMGDANGQQSSHQQFNDYLNTVRFVDVWLGQLLKIFEETGIANETLVLFVGDHGQAFREDFRKTGTYENGHISNYRVPLTFRHPHLPRIQYEANATSLSILPTVLDLLANTESLDLEDAAAAADLVHDYEGQSLIRPYKRSHNGRRAWNFGIVNPGGRLLTVTSADAPWRLVMPISEKAEYVFTDLKHDPLELRRLSKWSIDSLAHAVNHDFGHEAAQWVKEAEALAKWWTKSRKRLWRYRPK